VSSTFLKDPDSILDFSWSWESWLATGDTITAATVTGTGVTVDSTDQTTTAVTAWVSGGTAGETASLTCQITTADGRTDERTIRLSIRER
jgi:hypothetical protein